MLTKKEFISQVLADNPSFNEELLGLGYNVCCLAHANQKRKSGEPYAIHPIAVALEVSKLNLDEASVVSALLHDVIEDTKYTKDDIAQIFSTEIANIVDGATKFDKIKFQEKDIRLLENFRKLFIAQSKDVRVLIIKLCDRAHNMRTIEFQKPEKQREIALETIELYAPMAEKIGLQKIKNELQERSFAILKPDEYKEIKYKVDQKKRTFNSLNLIEDIINELATTLKENSVVATVFGREKTAYSIWRKMKRSKINFDEVSDIIAFRIIVNTVEDCYRALYAIHTTYNAIPGRFKDFISIPKSNGYRSLHTKIMGPNGNVVDIQIRTKEMHQEDECGIAAHYKYKHGLTKEEQIKYMRASWIKRALEILQQKNSKNQMSDVKTEISENRVIAFTQDGDVVDLPAGATILDFAFEINEDFGKRLDYAHVNGNHVGFDYKIKNGDKIIIFTSNEIQVCPAWINYAITGKARNAIIEVCGLKK